MHFPLYDVDSVVAIFVCVFLVCGFGLCGDVVVELLLNVTPIVFGFLFWSI